MTTVSVFRASAGGYVGGGHVHPAVLDGAREALAEAKGAGEVLDGFIARCGDDIGLVLMHEYEAQSPAVCSLAAQVFGKAAAVGARLHQHGINGHGPAVEGAELSFTARDSEPVICFFSDRAPPGAWNVHIYRAFADPFNTPSLVADRDMSRGFTFTVEGGTAPGVFDLPADLYRFLASAKSEGACVLEVSSQATGEVAAVASSGEDPVLLVRCGSPFPSVEETLEAFSVPYGLGSFTGSPGPLVPVSANGDVSARAAGRAIGLGFQMAPDRLVGPRDLLGDPAFDGARREAVVVSDYLRRHGPFASHANGSAVRV